MSDVRFKVFFLEKVDKFKEKLKGITHMKNNMKMYSLDEMIDKHVAPEGTSKREAFEAKVEERVREYEEKASMHIVVPVYVRDAIRRNAAALGESTNAYINNIFEQVVTPAAFA